MKNKINNWEQLPAIMNAEYVAILYGVNVSTIRRWCYSGILQGCKKGKRWFFDKDYIKASVGDTNG